MNTIKENLKEQAVALRELKNTISTGMREGGYMGDEQCEQMDKKQKFRYEHVAYSMAKGREYSEVENKVKEGNELDMDVVEKLMNEMKATLEASREVEEYA